MKKLLLIPFLLFADVDPFEAGLKSGYGLTSQEKAILQNKKSIDSLKKELKKLSTKISKIKSDNNLKFAAYAEELSTLKEKLLAFNSIIDELSILKADFIKYKKKSDEVNSTLQKLDANITYLNSRLNSLEKRVKVLEDSISQIVDIQNKNFNALKKSIQSILSQLKSTSLSKKDAFYLAREYFFNGNLKKAKALFLQSYNQGYLKATSAYYLGEIAFKQKNYKEALAYYKKSIEIYPKKTSFTTRLLYHTAISFEKLGNKKAAKLTLQKLIKDYPNSKYVKLAKKELEKLK